MVKLKKLDTYTRNEIMNELLLCVNKKGKPAHRLTGDIAKKYGVHWKTISKIWLPKRQVKRQLQMSWVLGNQLCGDGRKRNTYASIQMQSSHCSPTLTRMTGYSFVFLVAFMMSKQCFQIQ